MPFTSVLGSSSVIKPGVCTSSTRPTAPYVGQLVFETDTNRVAAYTASGWVYAHSSAVLQVKSTALTSTFTLASTSYTDITGLSVSITPTSSSSKVLIVVHMVNGYSTNLAGSFQIVRGSTAIALGDAAGSRTQCTIGVIPEDASAMVCSMTFLDSPATTSATTYKIQGRSNTGTIHINRTNGDADNSGSWRSISTITAYEVSA